MHLYTYTFISNFNPLDADSSPVSSHTPEPSPPSSPAANVSTNQQQLLEALQSAKLREGRLLLSLKGEAADRLLTAEMKSVEEAVERARLAAEELTKKREEEERQRREEEERRKQEEEEKR